jgi:hypothetical protein
MPDRNVLGEHLTGTAAEQAAELLARLVSDGLLPEAVAQEVQHG